VLLHAIAALIRSIGASLHAASRRAACPAAALRLDRRSAPRQLSAVSASGGVRPGAVARPTLRAAGMQVRTAQGHALSGVLDRGPRVARFLRGRRRGSAAECWPG